MKTVNFNQATEAKKSKMATQQSSANPSFDPKAVANLYMEAIEGWKKNCQNFAKTMTEALPGSSGNEAAAVSPLAELQNNTAQLFRKMVETEMELCRFYEKRWSQYLKLPEAMVNCNTNR